MLRARLRGGIDPDDIGRVGGAEALDTLNFKGHSHFAEGAANDYVEMFATLDTGLLFEDIQKTKPKIEGTSIEEFAKTWVAAYRRHGRAGDRPASSSGA
ncbi:MAG TPA: hypothetical protein VGP28_06715 [Methylocella sp.]|nr:hypothetical protein [Methylocella sp.]